MIFNEKWNREYFETFEINNKVSNTSQEITLLTDFFYYSMACHKKTSNSSNRSNQHFSKSMNWKVWSFEKRRCTIKLARRFLEKLVRVWCHTVFYSPQPRAEVYCLLMNFKISKLAYSSRYFRFPFR